MNIEIVILEANQFKEMIGELRTHNNDRKDLDICVSLVLDINEERYVVFDKSYLDDLDPDMEKILFAHECAHAAGDIIDEEEADIWALNHLNEIQSNILKDMWSERHGHEYAGMA